MAVVKLGRPVKSNLGGPNGAMAYIIDPAKTDGGRLVSSNYERTGGVSERCQTNREIRRSNSLLTAVRAELGRIFDRLGELFAAKIGRLRRRQARPEPAEPNWRYFEGDERAKEASKQLKREQQQEPEPEPALEWNPWDPADPMNLGMGGSQGYGLGL